MLMDTDEIVLCAVLGLAGLFFLFFGHLLIKPILFLSGTCTGGYIVYLILLHLKDSGVMGPNGSVAILTDSQLYWTMILCPLGIGAIIGALASTVVLKLGLFLLAALGGFAMSQAVLLWLSPLLSSHFDPHIVNWVTVIVCIIGCAVLVTFYQTMVMVVLTSFIGSLGICLASDIGFMQSQMTEIIRDTLTTRVIPSLHEKEFIMIGVYLGVAFIGIAVQMISTKRKNQAVRLQPQRLRPYKAI